MLCESGIVGECDTEVTDMLLFFDVGFIIAQVGCLSLNFFGEFVRVPDEFKLVRVEHHVVIYWPLVDGVEVSL